jgi:dephospho-CoA kinase
MRVIGLTGNIGSGKSVVADVWKELGAVVLDADRIAHEILVPGSEALEGVVARFGPGVLAEDGRLDRARLAEIVFADPDGDAVRRLNRIVHPLVGRRIRERLEAERRAGTRVVVVEAALIYEAGVEDEYDVVVVVQAPRERRYAWLAASRGLDPERAARIERTQIDPEEKAARADHLLENRGTLEELREAAGRLFRRLARAGEKGVDGVE